MRSKSEVLRQGKKEGKTVHFANFDGPLSPEERRPLQNTSKNTTGEWCSGETTSKTKKDTQLSTEQGASASQRAAVKFLRHHLEASWCGWSSQIVTIAEGRMS